VKYEIKIGQKGENCKNGTCGHPHLLSIDLPMKKQIVCNNLICKQVDVSLIKHIFVPYDGSSYSDRAVGMALDLASKYESEITLGTVVISSFFERSFLQMSEVERDVDKEKLDMIEKSFEKIKTVVKPFGVQIRTEVFVSSSVIDALASFSNSKNVDLIVMGTRGRGENRLFLDSVSIGLSQKARPPILLVK
jgi:nucleotide-binding universal stress UspA family protein